MYIWLALLLAIQLTIRQRARVVYEQVASEAQSSSLSLIDNEGKSSNCFSIKQRLDTAINRADFVSWWM